MVTVNDMARFSIEAPRYTSYPTAAEFSEQVGERDFRAALSALGGAPGGPGLALYVHLPFCRSICNFCGCHALAAHTSERINRYLTAVTTEAAEAARVLGGARRVSEAHFGGGSPSLLEAHDFERLTTALYSMFPFTADASLSIEADPRTTHRDKLRRYRAAGVRRISFGFQDLDADVQDAIGRHQAAGVSIRAVEEARAVGFQSINVDLCYGLPRQTEETFGRTIAEVITLRPDRIAVFGYAHVPWVKPMQRRIPTATLPGPALRLRLMASAREALIAAGYRAIGLDHFALPTDDLARAAASGTLNRNFQGYTTTNTDALVGLGLSAISDLPDGYFQNERALPSYHRAIERGGLATERGVRRSDDDRVRGEIIRSLMCRFGLDVRAVERRFGIDFAEAFAPELDELRALEVDGLLRVEPNAIVLTALGAAFVRNVARVFDSYRRGNPAATAGGRRFSTTA